MVAFVVLAMAPVALGARKPNIVLIQADDQTASQFTPRVMPWTSSLLANHGTTFTNYVATTPLCCPSRASLLTGQYAHNNGVWNNNVDGGYPALIDKANVLPVWLQEAGYRTIHVGKFLHAYGAAVSEPGEVAPGWDDWQTLVPADGGYYDYELSANGRIVHMGTGDDDYATRVITRKAVGAVRRYAPRAHPFYLQVDQRAPHGAGNNRPGRCRRISNPEPDPTDMGKFSNAVLPKPPSFDEADTRDKPEFIRELPRLTYEARGNIREHWSCALASLVGVDRSVASIFNAVKRAGELHRTAFIYISDNGHFFGEHRLPTGKIFPYEEALLQPLVIRLPRKYRDGVRRVESSGRPVANIDLAPTILDLAGGTPCPARGPCRTMDGRSVMPLLSRSGHWPRHRNLLTEFRDPGHRHFASCEFAGIRTTRGIYIEHYSVASQSDQRCQPTFQVERYNLADDPYELRNLCYGGLPGSCPAGAYQKRLERRLQRLRTCAGIRRRDQQVDGRPYCD
jgi:N-acetylglucosamine-6-sulfatase